MDGDQGIDLRRGHRGVPQQFLHHPDIGATLQQMRGELMPQHMRRNTGGDAGTLGRVLQNLPRALP